MSIPKNFRPKFIDTAEKMPGRDHSYKITKGSLYSVVQQLPVGACVTYIAASLGRAELDQASVLRARRIYKRSDVQVAIRGANVFLFSPKKIKDPLAR